MTLGLLAGYILIERRTKLISIADSLQDSKVANEQATQRIIMALQGVEVSVFKSVSECLQYVNKRLRSARIQIDDLSWTAAEGFSDDLEPSEIESLRYRKEAELTAKRIPYREVFIFNRDYRKSKLSYHIGNNVPGYSCAYFDWTPGAPLLQFMIIDKEEVIVLTGDYSYLAFRHSELVNLFVEYYEDIWKRARIIKRGKHIQWDELVAVLGREKTAELKSRIELNHLGPHD